MPAVLHTQLSEAINRIALLSASYMQAVMFFFFCSLIASAFNPLLRHHTGWNSNFTFLFCAAAAPHRVQQQK
jgi:hypothetical protein